MSIKISNIKERILYFAKNQHISYETFCDSIGMNYGSFKGIAKKRPINSDAIEILITKYPQVSIDWLFTGKEPMLKKDILNMGADTIEMGISSEDYERITELKYIISLQQEKIASLQADNIRLQTVVNGGTQTKRQAG
ncbi:hypothetical protein [Flavobacterium psychrophilum]|uniref:hypothetical protein n=1 Tax=Flavobacterium psychrophilum TaxID=96345 RepID=UPI000B7C13DB|nr:hypothetical protein [Flavobacterium psychrophilum]MBF2092050.1 hypothetical protein [Flavobacterium psychrophilum]MCB6230828.1 hypothetical protein [Flavobacterium psychrophilum]MEB3380738.1 hypothetical protein [Flavobacterium psychrophilum]SNA87612.1 hypothetical protein DK095_70024 [Flavobacterium psychrophilum]SNB10807.1 hypothetical protein JIP1600_1930002 [Flavobacterium psychrophilum]